MSIEQQREPSTALDLLRRPGLFALAGLIVVGGVTIDVITSGDDGPFFGAFIEAHVPQLDE
ncbi:hypothetical protein KDA23_06885 [Candidatus Saccharibacteria bacterium]|nr:hypothetical protein [Candidatus Saccharibacteria bacterium]